MLYNAQQINASVIDEATALLENASYLSESESQYYPEMVPIRENARLQKNVVRVEDLVEYSMANGITDGGIALQQICEASDVHMGSVVFSVDEVSVLEDVNMEDTVRGLIEAGATVYAAPVSRSNISSILAETVSDFMYQGEIYNDTKGSDALLEAFINDDFDSMFAEAVVMESVKEKAKEVGGKIVAKAEDVYNKVSSAIKQAATKSSKWIAEKISAFRTILGSLSEKAKSAGGSVKGAIGKVIDKIKQGIAFLSAQLKKAVDKVRG